MQISPINGQRPASTRSCAVQSRLYGAPIRADDMGDILQSAASEFKEDDGFPLQRRQGRQRCVYRRRCVQALPGIERPR